MRARSGDPRVRVLGAAAAGAIAGSLIGLLVASVLPARYEAQSSLLVTRRGELPLQPAEARQAATTVAELAGGENVVAGVRQSLGLAGLEIDATAGERSGIVVVSARADARDDAVRAAQRAALVLSQLVLTRLGPTGLNASVWVPARSASAVRPKRTAALAGGATGAAAAAAFAALRRRPPRPPREPVRQPVRSEPVARHANGTSTAQARGAGAYRLDELERLIDDAPVGTEEAARLRAYLAALRSHADDSGVIPASLDATVVEVFGSILDR